jgi:hypothetical protein
MGESTINRVGKATINRGVRRTGDMLNVGLGSEGNVGSQGHLVRTRGVKVV